MYDAQEKPGIIFRMTAGAPVIMWAEKMHFLETRIMPISPNVPADRYASNRLKNQTIIAFEEDVRYIWQNFQGAKFRNGNFSLPPHFYNQSKTRLTSYGGRRRLYAK
jgi:hypothetical protein